MAALEFSNSSEFQSGFPSRSPVLHAAFEKLPNKKNSRSVVGAPRRAQVAVDVSPNVFIGCGYFRVRPPTVLDLFTRGERYIELREVRGRSADKVVSRKVS